MAIDFIKKLSIEHFKGFYETETIDFGVPNNVDKGSGLTIIVGANNSGKSTVIDALKRFSSESQFDRSERHVGCNIKIRIENSSEGFKTLQTQEGGATCTIDRAIINPQRENFYPISSRRHFEPYFATSVTKKEEYRNSLYDRNKQSNDNSFGRLMKGIENDSSKKDLFNSYIKKLIPQFSDWNIELDRGSNYINYKTKNGAEHHSDLFGDGVISLFKICAGLVDFHQSDILIVDEPELSLHPQAQKGLAKLFSELSFNRQIILITHSTYFINWGDIKNGAQVIRLVKEDDKRCKVYKLSKDALYYEKLFSLSEQWQKPHMLDSTAKELFFSDNILFVEGQEDMGLLKKFVNEYNIEINFDFFGYGSDGAENIKHLLEMAKDLGLKAAALFDGDKESEKKTCETHFENQFLIKILGKPDIRDKHKKNPSDCRKELSEIEKEGIFDKSGNIKVEYVEYLKGLILEINSYFNKRIESLV